MDNRRFFRTEKTKRLIPCSCGSQAKLVKHKNYPFGRESKAITTSFYVCRNCNKKYFPSKIREVKK